MKPKSSCELCRRRHRRCITRPGATRCNGCDELDKDCQFGPKYQFRPAKQALKEDVSMSRTEDTEIHVSQGVADQVVGETSADRNNANLSSVIPFPQDESTARVGDAGSRASHARFPEPLIFSPQTAADSESPSSHRSHQVVQEGLGLARLPGRDTHPGVPLECRASSGVHEPQEARSSTGLSRREAFLFRTWIQKISLVSDAVDEARHFAVVVPRLAMQHPLILYSVLAIASRVDALTRGSTSDLESTYYHNICIELLIQSLSRDPETYDSILLAAVVISRLYEENDTETDTLTYHLEGTRTLLSHEVITRLAKEGGLAEAACWVHLRQAIYVAIVHRKHIDIPLGVYEDLTAFQRGDDSSYANRAVYIFAQILQALFPDPSDRNAPQTEDDFVLLQQKLAAWFDAKPLTFEPLFYEPADTESMRPFPSLWMVSTVQTVALQHYYSSMIVLRLRECSNPSKAGFEASRLRRHNEVRDSRAFENLSEPKKAKNAIAYYLCILMGLALSNELALNAWYLPCHMLDLCGYCIGHPTERDHTIKYLETVKQAVQWKTAPVIAALKKQWAELDGYES